MTSSTFNEIRVLTAEQFKESVSEPSPNTHMYIAYGRAIAWLDDANPNTSNTSVATKYEVWKNLTAAKKLTGSDMRHVIRRINWTANTAYNQYDHMNPSMYDDNVNFYVVTTQNHVYKCISNNSGGISNTEPTAINLDTTSTVVQDGYVWKYMYTLSDQELLRFTTSNYIPVKTLLSSDGSTQWTVQENADDGAISAITITNGGSGYTNTQNIVVTISGDGTGATAYANLNAVAQTVSSISVLSPGTGYTYATVSISGGAGANAAARALIPPPGGHGSNPLYELGGRNVMITARIAGTEANTLPVTHSFRQIALISDPLENDGVTVASNSIYEQVYTIPTIGSGSYTVGEYVYQGGSFAASTFNGLVIEDASGIIKVSNYTGSPTVGTLIGANTGTSRYVTSGTLSPELTKYSGQLLYVDNVKPISRNVDQTEEFKIVIKF